MTNLAKEGSTLYRNHRGSFNDVTMESGLARASFPFTGFGVGWFDYNNDGKLDLFAANGAVTIVEALRGIVIPYQQKNQLFHNDGEGKPLADVSAAAGPAFEQLQRGSRRSLWRHRQRWRPGHSRLKQQRPRPASIE